MKELASMIRFALLGLLAIALPAQAKAEAKLQVVASFSILADLVKNVGGERVVVDTLVGANADPHAYMPKPADAKKLLAAKVIFSNGLGFEGWIDKLIAGSGAKLTAIHTSRGIPVLDNGTGLVRSANPHAWQSVANAKVYVANIRDALVAADPAFADAYKANAVAYSHELDQLDKEIRTAISDIPETRRRIVTPHPSFLYFGRAYGLDIRSLERLTHDAEISAKTLADIITSVRRDRVTAIFFENNGDPRLMQQIARETGVAVGGPLYSDALTERDGAAPTYLAMMRQNLRTISDLLR